MIKHIKERLHKRQWQCYGRLIELHGNICSDIIFISSPLLDNWGSFMSDEEQIKKPVIIDWQQVFICNGWDTEVLNAIISDSLENEYKIEEL